MYIEICIYVGCQQYRNAVKLVPLGSFGPLGPCGPGHGLGPRGPGPCGHPWTRVGALWVLVGSPGPLWPPLGACGGPLGPCGPGPYGPPWALVGWALVGWALVGHILGSNVPGPTLPS